MWGGILILLLVVVLWTSRDRGTQVEEEELEEHKKEGEGWTLESAGENPDEAVSE